MKTRTLIAAALAASLGTQAWAEAPKMKMSTPVPEGIATPDRLETSIGTLTSVDGVPDAETTQKVFDNLDLNRATEAFLNGIPIASMYALKQGLLKHGPANTTAALFEELMDSKALWLTPNTTSVYMASWLELGDEPMVIETPSNVLGFINDAWFQYVTDFGNAGPDKGKGGKFMILPPGYEGDVPQGYHVAKTPTFGNCRRPNRLINKRQRKYANQQPDPLFEFPTSDHSGCRGSTCPPQIISRQPIQRTRTLDGVVIEPIEIAMES